MPTSLNKKNLFKLIAITTGDPNGIGFEVTAKSLVDKKLIKQCNNVIFFLFRDYQQHLKQSELFSKIDKKWNRIVFDNINDAFDFVKKAVITNQTHKNILIDLKLKTSAPEWVFLASKLCKQKKFNSLVTAPLSKTLINKSGFKQIGHTGIFKTFYPNKPLHMGFIGKDFNVVLATDHISLKSVSKSLTLSKLKLALNAGLELKKLLKSKHPIAVLGLNPHSGEEGLMGNEEKKYSQLLNSSVYRKNFVGPLIPDAAFLKKNWNQYCLYICLYHDQGLIPFKMHHGQDSGVHMTLGLPFIRTSVDHGTAFDLYNKNLANYASMLDAILINLQLLEKSHV